MTNKHQKIVATGFLFKNGKALAVKRAETETFLPGYFELPGGKVDFGEDPEQALQREFQEEVGLEIKAGKPFRTFAYTSDGGERHTIEIVYLALTDEENPEVTLGKDHTEYHWMEEGEVGNYKFSDETRQSILEGFKEASLLEKTEGKELTRNQENHQESKTLFPRK